MSTLSPAASPALSDDDSPGGLATPLHRLARRMLRVSLNRKIVFAALAVAAVAGGVGSAGMVWFADRPPAQTLLAAGLLAVFTLAALSFATTGLVRLALSPVAELERTAALIRRGDLAARARPSPLTDRHLDAFTRTFNEMMESVQGAQARQRELAMRVLDAEERERDRLAHELYGGAAQTLAGILVRLRLAEREEGDVCGRYAEIREEVARTLDEIREVARRLRPPELDELGIQAALEAHARRLTDGRALRMSFNGRVSEACLSAETRLALFRVLQEALTNAARHAHATQVTTTFRGTARGLEVTVVDDGDGFDPAMLPGSAPEGLGILGMRERVGYVSGELTVDSTPGEGTRVGVRVPWSTTEGLELGTGPERLAAVS